MLPPDAPPDEALPAPELAGGVLLLVPPGGVFIGPLLPELLPAEPGVLG